MEALGPKIRRKRRELGLTLDELTGRTGISKPYLSLIETGRVNNPPSDEKLRLLERALGFSTNELIGQAHLQRTPRDVRAMLAKLLKEQEAGFKGGPNSEAAVGAAVGVGAGVDLDAAYSSGALQQLVDQRAGNVEPVRTNAVPVINKVSAGYPQDFTDLSYPPRVADTFVGAPEVDDPDAFACRVHGDSMSPKYNEGDIVIFSPAIPPRDGDDCFVRFDDAHSTFKRIFFEAEAGRPMIRLQPRNERYRPQTVPAEKVEGLYRAVWRYERVDG